MWRNVEQTHRHLPCPRDPFARELRVEEIAEVRRANRGGVSVIDGRETCARFLIVAFALSASSAQSQMVHGHASLSGSTGLVSGVMVTLLDSTGAVRTRGLTSELGEFRLRARAQAATGCARCASVTVPPRPKC